MNEFDARRAKNVKSPPEPDIDGETPSETFTKIKHDLEERGEYTNEIVNLARSALNMGRLYGWEQADESWWRTLSDAKFRAKLWHVALFLVGFITGISLILSILQ